MYNWKVTFALMAVPIAIAGCATASRRAQDTSKASPEQAGQIGIACAAYALDHDDMLPASTSDLEVYLEHAEYLNDFEMVAKGKMRDYRRSDQVLAREIVRPGQRQYRVVYVSGASELLSVE